MMDVIINKVVFVIVVLTVLKIATIDATADNLAGDHKALAIDSDYQAWTKYKAFGSKDKLGFRKLPASHSRPASLSNEIPAGWWELFPPMSNAPPVAPAPSFDFPWWKLFPPMSNVPSQTPAPAPSFDFPWWKLFPPMGSAPSPSPALPPSFDFPWWKLFPPMMNAPSPSPDLPPISDIPWWTWLSPAQAPSTINFRCC